MVTQNELYHYGILGMKWGIRRYQNEDGTLTEAGKKRLSEKAGTYLNPYYKDKNSNKRKIVSKEYEDAYNKIMSNGEEYDSTVKRTYEVSKSLGDDDWGDKLWNSFIDKYADATLEDLGYANTKQAKEFVKSCFEDEIYYKYDVINKKSNSSYKTSLNNIDVKRYANDKEFNRNWELKNKQKIS